MHVSRMNITMVARIVRPNKVDHNSERVVKADMRTTSGSPAEEDAAKGRVVDAMERDHGAERRFQLVKDTWTRHPRPCEEGTDQGVEILVMQDTRDRALVRDVH